MIIRPTALLACFALLGCSAGTLPPSDAGTTSDSSTTYDASAGSGTLVIAWTIQSSNDAAACTTHTAASIKLVVAGNGSSGTTYFAPCTDFTKSLDLAAGMYSVQATLLDPQNGVRTTTASLVTTVNANKSNTETVDFPNASFF